MTTVRRWTGHETRALRMALRLSVRAFAEYLGVAVRTVSKWESGTEPDPVADEQPHPSTQPACAAPHAVTLRHARTGRPQWRISSHVASGAIASRNTYSARMLIGHSPTRSVATPRRKVC
jgi:DNA-binding XRE family transcriptional regulator